MRVFAYAVLAVLILAVYVYFFGTPWVADLTGLSPRFVSLTAGVMIAILGFASMMFGKLLAKRDAQDK